MICASLMMSQPKKVTSHPKYRLSQPPKLPHCYIPEGFHCLPPNKALHVETSVVSRFIPRLTSGTCRSSQLIARACLEVGLTPGAQTWWIGYGLENGKVNVSIGGGSTGGAERVD